MMDILEKILNKLQHNIKPSLVLCISVILGIFDFCSIFNVRDTISIIGLIVLIVIYFFCRCVFYSKTIRVKTLNIIYSFIIIILFFFSVFWGHSFYPVKYVIDKYHLKNEQLEKSYELAQFFYLFSQGNFEQSAEMLPIEDMEIWEIFNYNLVERIEELDNMVTKMNQGTMLDRNMASIYVLSRISAEKSSEELRRYTSELMESIPVVPGYVKTAYLISLAELGDISAIEQFLQDETIEVENAYYVRNAQANNWLYLYNKLKEWNSVYTIQCLANAFACDRILTSNQLFRSNVTLLYTIFQEVDYERIKECREQYDAVFELYDTLNSTEFEKLLDYGMHIGSYKALEYKLYHMYNKNEKYVQNVLSQIQSTDADFFSFGIMYDGTVVGLHSITREFSKEASQPYITFDISIIDDKHAQFIAQQDGLMIYNINLDCFDDIFILKFSEDENEHYLRLKMYNLQRDEFIELDIPQSISKAAYRAIKYNAQWKGGTVEVTWYGEEEIESYIEKMRVYASAQIVYDMNGVIINELFQYTNPAIEYFVNQGKLQLQFQNFIESGWIKDKDFLRYIKEEYTLNFKYTWLEEFYLGLIDFTQPDYLAMIFYVSDGDSLWVEDKYYLLLYKINNDGMVDIVNIYQIFNYGSSTWNLSEPIINVY